MEFTDLINVLFLLICLWLAVTWDDSDGGGHLSRVPVA